MSVCDVAGERIDPDDRGGSVAQTPNVERLRSLVAWQLAEAGIDRPTIAAVLRCSDRTVYRRLATIPQRVKRRGANRDLGRVLQAG